MRKISENSQKIIKLIEEGKLQFEIRNLGFKNETVRYYFRKIKTPEKFNRVMQQIQKYNKNRVLRKKSVSSK